MPKETMTRALRGTVDKRILTAVSENMLEMIAAVSEPGETRSDFIRKAISAEILRRSMRLAEIKDAAQ